MHAIHFQIQKDFDLKSLKTSLAFYRLICNILQIRMFSRNGGKATRLTSVTNEFGVFYHTSNHIFDFILFFKWTILMTKPFSSVTTHHFLEIEEYKKIISKVKKPIHFYLHQMKGTF